MKKSVLIIDADERFRTELAAVLNIHGDFEVGGIAADGEQAIQMAEDLQPDIIVMDLLLPRYDGITVLERLRNQLHRPQILVTSAFISNFVAASALRMGAKQLICKPCSVHVVTDNIQRMAAGGSTAIHRRGKQSMEALVSGILHELGVPAHIKGYQYLREAIILAVKNEDAEDAISKTGYSEVANVYNTTVKKVESAMRRAVEMAWERGDLDVLQRYFGCTVSKEKGKPTNSEFISMIADQIRLG